MRFLLIVLILMAFQASSKPKSDSLYVISMGGTGLYKQPHISSELLAQVPFCYGLQVDKQLKQVDSCAAPMDTLRLVGSWVKVNYKGQKGYVFNANCVPYKVSEVQLVDGFYMGRHPSFSVLGEVIPTNQTVQNQSDEMEVTIRYTYGSYLKKWDEYGCYQEVYTFYRANFNVVYHYLRSLNYNVEYLDERPYYVFSQLLKRDGNTYSFSEINGRTDLEIELKTNGTIELSWWVCL